MTPFRNDDGNPFNRQSIWPRMPQTALGVSVLARPTPPPQVAPEPEPAPGEAEPMLATPLEDAPLAAPIGVRPVRTPRRELRLTPLIAAAAVGAGGTAALFLLIGMRPPAAPVASAAPSPSTLAVGDLVGGPAPLAAPAATIAAPAAAAPRPAARLAAASPPPSPRATLTAASTSAAGIHVPAIAAAPFSTQLQLPSPPPAADARPAETQAPPPPAAPFTRPAAPDPAAPIPTHVPDGS